MLKQDTNFSTFKIPQTLHCVVTLSIQQTYAYSFDTKIGTVGGIALFVKYRKTFACFEVLGGSCRT